MKETIERQLKSQLLDDINNKRANLQFQNVADSDEQVIPLNTKKYNSENRAADRATLSEISVNEEKINKTQSPSKSVRDEIKTTTLVECFQTPEKYIQE